MPCIPSIARDIQSRAPSRLGGAQTAGDGPLIKKIGSWFTKGVPNGVAFRQKLQQMNEPSVLMAELEALKHGHAA